jgi:hypothetical protein
VLTGTLQAAAAIGFVVQAYHDMSAFEFLAPWLAQDLADYSSHESIYVLAHFCSLS